MMPASSTPTPVNVTAFPLNGVLQVAKALQVKQAVKRAATF